MSLRAGVRDLRMRLARLPRMGVTIPEAPAVTVRDPWPGDAVRGARLLKGELVFHGALRSLKPGGWPDAASSAALREHAHGFTWLRDLREIGTDAARMRARALVGDWIDSGVESVSLRPHVTGARLMAWLGHFDFLPPPPTIRSARPCCGAYSAMRVSLPLRCRRRRWMGGRSLPSRA